MELKKSRLYSFLLKTINGENINDFDLGKSSKDMLKKIKYFLEKDTSGEFMAKLLKARKINLSIARRMILNMQSEIRLREEAEEQIKKESSTLKIVPKVKLIDIEPALEKAINDYQMDKYIKSAIQEKMKRDGIFQ